jgi:hypothetical protein
MKSNMMRTLFAGLVLTCASLTPSLATEAAAQNNPSAQQQLHPRDISRLLHIASAHWDITVGKARQAYRSGEMTFVVGETKPAGREVMIFFQNDCILATLLDDF